MFTKLESNVEKFGQLFIDILLLPDDMKEGIFVEKAKLVYWKVQKL